MQAHPANFQAKKEMDITRIYTGPDGESHFEDVKLPLEETVDADRKSEPMTATGIVFRTTGHACNLDWHNAPCRQFVIPLEGKVEIELGDGTKRQFGPGDILLAEDTTGRGHTSCAVNDQPRRTIFITLE